MATPSELAMQAARDQNARMGQSGPSMQGAGGGGSMSGKGTPGMQGGFNFGGYGQGPAVNPFGGLGGIFSGMPAGSLYRPSFGPVNYPRAPGGYQQSPLALLGGQGYQAPTNPGFMVQEKPRTTSAPLPAGYNTSGLITTNSGAVVTRDFGGRTYVQRVPGQWVLAE